MKCSLGISNFLEEISSHSHSTVFLYFSALIDEEGFLISLCYFLELCIQLGISFLFSFFFPTSLLFIAIYFAQKLTATTHCLLDQVQSPLHNLYHNLAPVHISFSILHDVTSTFSCNKSWFSPTNKISSWFCLTWKASIFLAGNY